MIIENSSDLIRDWKLLTLGDGTPVAEAELVNGNALVISPGSIALFRRPGDCTNPLAGGLVRSEALSEALLLQPPFIEEHRAGFVGLTDGLALLIGLNDVRMYPNRNDALRNQNMICELSLAVD
ncbi:MAG TPA: hypothetical protein DE015_11540 [Oceanospirillales bacterium]|nr:hypothetical protein [Oceanospirillales bacterium]